MTNLPDNPPGWDRRGTSSAGYFIPLPRDVVRRAHGLPVASRVVWNGASDGPAAAAAARERTRTGLTPEALADVAQMFGPDALRPSEAA